MSEQLPAQLTEVQSQLKAAEASFSKKLEEQTQSSLARENAVKDSCQQRISGVHGIDPLLTSVLDYILPSKAALSLLLELFANIHCGDTQSAHQSQEHGGTRVPRNNSRQQSSCFGRQG